MIAPAVSYGPLSETSSDLCLLSSGSVDSEGLQDLFNTLGYSLMNVPAQFITHYIINTLLVNKLNE